MVIWAHPLQAGRAKASCLALWFGSEEHEDKGRWMIVVEDWESKG